tara:strand:+ start:1294 stop:1641 length:348 start_codon:yes stop_codon:yes gene_type:complete
MILIATVLISLSACDGGSNFSENEGYYPDHDETDISDSDGEEKGNETYEEYDERRDSYEGAFGSYEGDGCTIDCSGHEAGYEWAQERGIDDPDKCGGNSWSFEEGCRAYAGQNRF